MIMCMGVFASVCMFMCMNVFIVYIWYEQQRN